MNRSSLEGQASPPRYLRKPSAGPSSLGENLPDPSEPPLDRRLGYAEPGRDLRVAAALQLPHRNGAQLGVSQPIEEELQRFERFQLGRDEAEPEPLPVITKMSA